MTRLTMRAPKDHPDLRDALQMSAKLYDAMTPEQRRELHATQRKSWVIGEMMIERPELTREDAERIYDAVS